MTQGSEVRNAAPIDKNVRLSNDLTLSKELTESVPPVKPEDTARNYFDNYLPNFNEPIERVAAKGLAKNAITHATAGMVSGKRIDSTVELAQLKLLEYSLKNPGTIENFADLMKSKAFNELVEHWSNPDLQQSVVDRLKASMKNYMSSEFGIALPAQFKLTSVQVVLPESKGVKPIHGFWIEGTDYFIAKNVGYVNRPVADMGMNRGGIYVFFPSQKVNGMEVKNTPMDTEKKTHTEYLREMTMQVVRDNLPIKTITLGSQTEKSNVGSAQYDVELVGGKKFLVTLTPSKDAPETYNISAKALDTNKTIILPAAWPKNLVANAIAHQLVKV